MTVHPEAAVGFRRATDAYERGRPGYPAEVVRWLCDHVGVMEGRRIVDLAAGTGKLTRALIPTGAAIVAVEPVQAMLRVLRAATDPPVHAVVATAQALPLATGSVDGIGVAQAFHWFATDAALAEMIRVLRPGAVIGLVWNVRRLDDPLQAAISTIIDPYRGDTPAYASGRWRHAIERSPLVRCSDGHAVAHDVQVDVDSLVDRVVSTSYIAALPADGRATVARRVRDLQATFGPAPVLRYRCEAHLLTPC
jgi:SAM-dependent methyltransferase